jgi:hypothetical protein
MRLDYVWKRLICVKILERMDANRKTIDSKHEEMEGFRETDGMRGGPCVGVCPKGRFPCGSSLALVKSFLEPACYYTYKSDDTASNNGPQHTSTMSKNGNIQLWAGMTAVGPVLNGGMTQALALAKTHIFCGHRCLMYNYDDLFRPEKNSARKCLYCVLCTRGPIFGPGIEPPSAVTILTTTSRLKSGQSCDIHAFGFCCSLKCATVYAELWKKDRGTHLPDPIVKHTRTWIEMKVILSTAVGEHGGNDNSGTNHGTNHCRPMSHSPTTSTSMPSMTSVPPPAYSANGYGRGSGNRRGRMPPSRQCQQYSQRNDRTTMTRPTAVSPSMPPSARGMLVLGRVTKPSGKPNLNGVSLSTLTLSSPTTLTPLTTLTAPITSTTPITPALPINGVAHVTVAESKIEVADSSLDVPLDEFLDACPDAFSLTGVALPSVTRNLSPLSVELVPDDDNEDDGGDDGGDDDY